MEQKNDVAATTQDVLTHHLTCFGKGDIGGTMADYTAESRLFTPDGLLRGSEAIRRFFVGLFEEFAKPGMSFEMLGQEVDGDTAYIVWKAETADSLYELRTDNLRRQGRTHRDADVRGEGIAEAAARPGHAPDGAPVAVST